MGHLSRFNLNDREYDVSYIMKVQLDGIKFSYREAKRNQNYEAIAELKSEVETIMSSSTDRRILDEAEDLLLDITFSLKETHCDVAIQSREHTLKKLNLI